MNLLIDAHAICHAEKHSLDFLSYEEKKVGVIFGFLRQLLSLSKTFNCGNFIFAWDSRESVREQLFSGYKYKRKNKTKTPEERKEDNIAYDQFNIVREEVLPTIGFKNNFQFEGYEADDIIAKICFTYPQKEIKIISSDEDLYQLLSKNISMYSIKKKQSYTVANLWKDYRVTPSQWGEVKAISGCTTDEVPGVPNVAEITASKYVTKKLPRHLKTYQAIESNHALIERNRPLVVLPFHSTPNVLLHKQDDLSLKNFIMIAQRYGFQSFMNEKALQDWKKYIFKEK